MGFQASNVENIKKEPNNELNRNEIIFLLQNIKNNTFKGEDIEILYNIILKLQSKI